MMEAAAEQTGFSSSSPSGMAGVAAAATTCSDDAGDSTPPTPSNRGSFRMDDLDQWHLSRVRKAATTMKRRIISVKEEPEDDVQTVVVTTNQAPLPSIGEENWRTYYQHPLVVLNGGPEDAVNAIYETYKLPSLAKFGKGLQVGKLPAAIWSVVAQPEAEIITPNEPNPSPPVSSPASVQDLTAPLYLHRHGDKIVVQSADHREETVIQQVPDDKSQEVDTAQAMEVVKSPEDDETSQRHREIQADQAQAEIQIDGTAYSNSDFSPNAYEQLGTGQYSVLTNVVVTVAPPQYGTTQNGTVGGVYTLAAGDYYTREYYAQPSEQYAQAVRHHLSSAYSSENSDNVTYVERYIRQNYKNSPHGLTVDLPSPDSGIGGESTITPRDSLHQIFDYAEIAPTQPLLQQDDDSSTNSRTTPIPSPARKNSWNHEYGRNAELDKVQIPKIFSDVGFRYYLESPISTSQRREDDRMTYINKGQYYGITLEYIPDPDRPLRTCTVKSIVMLVFREEKSPEDELKAWKFWHSRQHSVKQRILDADTKNSSGIIGQIEEVTHNAIAFYWNPMEGSAKISVSVHCLSTDFSNQKGVKGFPLHIQVDTTDDLREGAIPIHRGYCQIKVFCDKGAERKTRDEERRAAKRKLTATGNSRKKIEEMYHTPCERSEFYSMSDLAKPPILFTPEEDSEKTNGPELAFYTITSNTSDENSQPLRSGLELMSQPTEIKNTLDIPLTPPVKKFKLAPTDRVLLYVKRADEEIFHPLHLVPPTLSGLGKAIENKYNISTEMIRNFYKRCKKGITVMMDDDIVRLYCNEDTFILDVIKTEDNKFDVTLVEL